MKTESENRKHKTCPPGPATTKLWTRARVPEADTPDGISLIGFSGRAHYYVVNTVLESADVRLQSQLPEEETTRQP